MDWDKLRIFHTVARSGSLTRAGEALKLSQSALSRQISALEESLEVPLLHRHPRGIALTEQGEMLLQATQDIAGKVNLVEGQIRDTREAAAGPLKITVSDFIGSTWLAPKLANFKEANPDIQLSVLFDEQKLNLGMREADAAIRLGAPKEAGLVQKKLTQIYFHICASKTYLKKHGRPQQIEDLKNHCLLAYPANTLAPFANPNWLFELAGVEMNDRNSNLFMMNSMYAIHKTVTFDAGIAVLPDYLIAQNDALEVVLPETNRPPVDMYFVYAEERRNSKRIELFRDFLLENVHRIPTSRVFSS